MTILREAAQQALEALEQSETFVPYEGFGMARKEAERKHQAAIAALRAALAQQDQPQGCATEEDCTKQPWCRIRGECQRKQAEPVEPHRWEGDNNIESPFNACMHKTYCMTLKQAEPLNLRDPAVQKRLATQWGYVPAAQAEPVEPVAGVVLNEEGRAALVEHGREEWHCVSRNARRLYTAPPQRKPLPKHDQHCVDVPGYGLMAVRLVRAVERAHGIKE